MLEKLLETTILFDFYGQLLTDKQRAIMSMHYLEDLALAEIAENLDISRQAVYDHINKAIKLLHGYEEKLHLVARFEKRQSTIEQVIKDLSLIDCAHPELNLNYVIESLMDTAE